MKSVQEYILVYISHISTGVTYIMPQRKPQIVVIKATSDAFIHL